MKDTDYWNMFWGIVTIIVGIIVAIQLFTDNHILSAPWALMAGLIIGLRQITD